MGSGRLARDGVYPPQMARNRVRLAAGRICRRLFARGSCVLFRISTLGLATYVLHRRPPGSAVTLYPGKSKGEPRLACVTDAVGDVSACPCQELAIVYLFGRADGRHELHVAWHTGSLSHV